MTTPIIQKVIEDTVSDHIQQNNEFSAWDITREVRLLDYKLRHTDCREIVHQMYFDQRMPGYDRTLRLVGLHGEEAWIYHPIPTATVLGGFPAVSNTLTPSSMRTYGAPLAIPAPTSPLRSINRSKSDPIIKSQDKRGRLLIPKHLNARAGLSQYGDLAYLFQIGTFLHISNYATRTSVVLTLNPDQKKYTPLATYLLDHHGNFYISRKMLSTTDLDGKQIMIKSETHQGFPLLTLHEA